MTSERPSERLTVNGASLRQFKGIHALFKKFTSGEKEIPEIDNPEFVESLKTMCRHFHVAIMGHRTKGISPEEIEKQLSLGKKIRSELRGHPHVKGTVVEIFLQYVIANTLEETSRLYRNAADPNYSGEDPPSKEEGPNLTDDLHSALTGP